MHWYEIYCTYSFRQTKKSLGLCYLETLICISSIFLSNHLVSMCSRIPRCCCNICRLSWAGSRKEIDCHHRKSLSYYLHLGIHYLRQCNFTWYVDIFYNQVNFFCSFHMGLRFLLQFCRRGWHFKYGVQDST